MNRSIPLAKAMDDAMIALYQNGERINPFERLSDATVAARLRGQHERQMAAPDQLVEAPVMLTDTRAMG